MFNKRDAVPCVSDADPIDSFNFEFLSSSIGPINNKNEQFGEYISEKIDDGDKNPQQCYICNKSSEFYYRNLHETKSKHSKTRILDFIVKWLGDNQSVRTNAINTADDSKDDHSICGDCLNQINEYDLMSVTAERIDRKLRNVFLHTESIYSIEPKIEPNEEMDYEHNEEAIATEVTPYDEQDMTDNDVEDFNEEVSMSEEEHEENSSNVEQPISFKCKKCNIILNRYKVQSTNCSNQ